MKYLVYLLMSFAFIAALNSCTEDDTTSPGNNEFIADNNTFKNFMSWTLVASNKGPDPALGQAHAGNDTSVTRKIYIKKDQDKVNGEFPVGTVVVKHTKNPDGSVNEFTAMAKRGNDFNSQGGDWEWFLLNSDGTIGSMEGEPTRGANLMDGMCAGCHASPEADDFVFSK